MSLRQAAQHALKVMDDHMYRADTHEFYEAKEALRAALAEPEQTPKGWIDETAEVPEHLWKEWSEGYPAPTPRRPLTDEEIDRVTDQQWAQNNHKPIYAAHRAYARAIEKAHGIGEQHE